MCVSALLLKWHLGPARKQPGATAPSLLSWRVSLKQTLPGFQGHVATFKSRGVLVLLVISSLALVEFPPISGP